MAEDSSDNRESGDVSVAASCAFCGASGRLTREHVFGKWLGDIGLSRDPVPMVAGPLNRLGRDLGVTPPFRQTVQDVCGSCNNGWMSRLEGVAKQALTPFILGQPGSLLPGDQGAIAAWVEKTALVAMLVSPEEARANGYGLPRAEYRMLYERRETAEPLPASRMWIGRYAGGGRLVSLRVTPLVIAVENTDEPAWPQGYAITIVLGELLLHGVRFTTPMLDLDVSTRSHLPQLWPISGPVEWPSGDPVDDEAYLGFAEGGDLIVMDPGIALHPWTTATDLPASQLRGSMIELPTLCGEHTVFYPRLLVTEAIKGRLYAFMTSCECPVSYLVMTAPDGAHFREAADADVICDRYESIEGEEVILEDENGAFVCRRLSAR